MSLAERHNKAEARSQILNPRRLILVKHTTVFSQCSEQIVVKTITCRVISSVFQSLETCDQFL